MDKFAAVWSICI